MVSGGANIRAVDDQNVACFGYMMQHVAKGCSTGKTKAQQASHGTVIIKYFAQFIFQVAIDIVTTK